MVEHHPTKLVDGRQRKREVPVFVPFSFLGFLLVCLVLFYIMNPASLQLLFVFPMGLPVFFAERFRINDESTRMMLGVPLVVASYCIYGVLLAFMLFARQWRTFSIVCFVLLCILLINFAGCRSVINDLSNIQ